MTILLGLGLGSGPDGPLQWSTDLEECPDADTVVARLPAVAEGVDYDRFVARVRREGSAWIAELSGAQERTIEAASCDELADAVVLLVELSMSRAEHAASQDDARADEESMPQVQPEPTSEPAGEPTLLETAPTTPTSTREPGARRQQALSWGVAGVGGASFVVVPSAAGDFSLYAGPRGRSWALDLGMLGRPAFDGATVEVPNVGASLSTWAGLVRACGVPAIGRIEIAMCGGLEAGALFGRGEGDLAVARRASAPWVAARLDGGLRVEAHPRVRPTLWVSGVALVTRPRFSIDGAGRVCCDEPVGISVGAGVEIRVSAKTGAAGH